MVLGSRNRFIHARYFLPPLTRPRKWAPTQAPALKLGASVVYLMFAGERGRPSTGSQASGVIEWCDCSLHWRATGRVGRGRYGPGWMPGGSLRLFAWCRPGAAGILHGTQPLAQYRRRQCAIASPLFPRTA